MNAKNSFLCLVCNIRCFLQAKIQELAEHVPKGHIPRSMTVHFRGELTRKVSDFMNFWKAHMV